MNDPRAPDAPSDPQQQSDAKAAREFCLFSAGQVPARPPPRRCYLPDLARRPTPPPTTRNPETTRP